MEIRLYLILLRMCIPLVSDCHSFVRDHSCIQDISSLLLLLFSPDVLIVPCWTVFSDIPSSRPSPPIQDFELYGFYPKGTYHILTKEK